MQVKGFVSSIQRFSLDDGPGIRTTVFFGGCNLDCAWCHNPECIPPAAQLRYQDTLCIRCGLCVNACPQQVHSFDGRSHGLDRAACISCGACVRLCPADALSLSGEFHTSDELMAELAKDRVSYEVSGGGVTFSGGEAMLQLPFLSDMLEKCRKAGIHTAVDTAGNLAWEPFLEILPLVDLFLFDIKMVSPEKHLLAAGTDNGQILQNLESLVEHHARVWVRVPLIPVFHDAEEITKIADFLANLPVERIELLPYHRYGVGKYRELGWAYLLDCPEPSAEWLQAAASAFSGSHAPVRVK